MTTIVYRDGILAADTRAYSGDQRPLGKKNKIHQLECGSFVACSSHLTGIPELFVSKVAKLGHKTILDKCIEVTALLVTREGELFFFNDGVAFSGPIECEFASIGSGDRYALGALERGATAEEAVLVASALDVYTNDEISVQKITVGKNGQAIG